MTTVKPVIRFNETKTTEMRALIDQLSLNTVCTEAACPNLGECFSSGTATFMILGRNCSRNCRFCDVTFGHMEQVDKQEPKHIADAVEKLNLNHVVITSVARDDLEDGGANQFAECIREIRKRMPDTSIEVLIPDFQNDKQSLDAVIAAEPDIINHNIETVERISPQIRHRATYRQSLAVLDYIKTQAPKIFTKSGIMLGLGETYEEVLEAMDDCLDADVDFFTIGQYLQPSDKHFPLKEYLSLRQFGEYRQVGMSKGFKFVASSPQVRSSYKALEAYKQGGNAS